MLCGVSAIELAYLLKHILLVNHKNLYIMLQTAMKYSTKALGAFFFLLINIAAQAQDKVEIDTQEVKSWFERNWIWVAGAVLLLLLIVLLGRRKGTGGQRRTTTVIKDPDGKVKSVTTTEEKL